MTEITPPLEQKYVCTANECTKEFTSIHDWRKHVEGYSFEKGLICLHNGCGELIRPSSNKSRDYANHLYLKHNFEHSKAEEEAESLIGECDYSVEDGRIWCPACVSLWKLGNCEKALDHVERHVLDGLQIKILGQTRYPRTVQVREAEAGTSERAANEGDGDVIDLSRRGTVAWIGPA